jgi:hypothetical protein
MSNLIELREQIQHDLITLMDGLPDELITAACQVVVDRVNEYLETQGENV